VRSPPRSTSTSTSTSTSEEGGVIDEAADVLLDTRAVCALLGRSRATLSRLRREDPSFPMFPVGGAFVAWRSALRYWLACREADDRLRRYGMEHFAQDCATDREKRPEIDVSAWSTKRRMAYRVHALLTMNVGRLWTEMRNDELRRLLRQIDQLHNAKAP
jgi:predicted DNA-binding transcriptional regulator AlpA